MQTELEYLLWFLRKSQITSQDTVNIEVIVSIYMVSLFNFIEIFKILFLLLGKDPWNDLVETELKYLVCLFEENSDNRVRYSKFEMIDTCP